mgnify:FL=1
MISGDMYETIKSTSYMNVSSEIITSLTFVREHENLSCGINSNYERLSDVKNEARKSHESGFSEDFLKFQLLKNLNE